MRKLRIVMVGAGDIAKRLARSSEASRARWYGLARTKESADALRTCGILPIRADLDVRATLLRSAAVARSAHATCYFAPPPNTGNDDPRMRYWIAAVSKPLVVSSTQRHKMQRKTQHEKPAQKKRRMRMNRCVYISTTGVYGDRAGAWVNETSKTFATSARSKRRVAAESRLRNHRQHHVCILRAPGIYAAERLPIERLRGGTPALLATEDVFTNHIHADDLAHAAWLAMFRGRSHRVLNIVDDAKLKMGEYFDTVAGALGLPKPPRLSRLMLQREVTPMLYSFMSESRRIDNARMKRELRIRLRYATPQLMLAQMKPSDALQQSLI